MSSPVQTLGDLRHKVLGFTLDGVVRLSGIMKERLLKLEANAGDLSVWESETLSRLYGVDADVLATVPLKLSTGEVASVLASSDEFHFVGDLARSRVVGAARAARDLTRLRKLLDVSLPEVPRITAPPATDDVQWKVGAQVAEIVRREIGPTDGGAILSMRDWVKEYLPGVTLLYAHMGDLGPAAVSIAGFGVGPTIAVNLDGKNENPCVRRFSLAHEIYHVLVDWTHVEGLASLSGYLTESQLGREQRANSFAIRFLCPESATHRFHSDHLGAAQKLVATWGLHYSAARLYLQNLLNAHLPYVPPASLGATGTEAIWSDREEPEGLAGFPLDEVPPERRSEVARLATQAYSRGLVPRDEFAELLGVTPAADLERVVSYFGMDPPSSEAAA